MIDRDPSAVFMRHIEAAVEIWLERLAEPGDRALVEADREKDNLYQLLQHGLHLDETVQLTTHAALQAFELVERRGYWDEWLALLERANRALTTDDLKLTILLLNRMGQIKRLKNQADESIAHCVQALEIARKINDPRLTALSQYNLAEGYLKKFDFNRVDTLGEEALEYFELEGSEPRLIASLLNTLGESARQQDRLERADTLLTRAVKLAGEHNIPFLEARFRSNLALTRNARGHPNEAIDQLERAEHLLEGSLNEFDRVTLQLNKGFILAGQDRWRAAADAFQKVDLAYLTQRQNTFLLALTNTNLGFSLLMNGDLQTAEPFLQDGLRYWETYGDKLNLANAVGCLGKLFRARGESEAAVAQFQRAITLLEPIENNPTADRYTAEFKQYLVELAS